MLMLMLMCAICLCLASALLSSPHTQRDITNGRVTSRAWEAHNLVPAFPAIQEVT